MNKSMQSLPAIFCLLVLSAAPVLGQGQTRDIFPEQFVKSRPGKSEGAAKKPVYRRVETKAPATQKGPGPVPASYQQLGMTVWRMRRARNNEPGVRIIVQEEGEAAEWIPERIEANTPLNMGEKIRLSFEAQQAGYLYVIDREQYADGSLGDPYLIFPTTRTRNGDNQVAPGRVIEIPGQEDRPNFFSMRQSRPDQTGERLTVLVTPAPLTDITIGAKALKLSNEQVAQWEKTWATSVERFEMADGAGQTWTRAEKEAGSAATRQLTQDDPPPQTVYRVAAAPDAPLLVSVGLRYRRK